MFTLAYHLPGVGTRVAKESAPARRLLQQMANGINGSWRFHDHPDGGAIAVYRSEGEWAGDLGEFGPPRPTADGLTYYPPREPPELLDLLKGESARPADGEWVTTADGAELWIAVAALSERRWILSATGATRTAPIRSRYGVLARRLYDLAAAPAGDRDPEVTAQLEVQLVVAAIQVSYDATDELIEDLPALHLSDTDIGVIRGVAWGLDPKESAAAAVRSRSALPAAESQTSPSPLPSPPPSPVG